MGNDPINLHDDEPFTLGNVPDDIWLGWALGTLAMIAYWYFRYRKTGVLTFDVFFVGLYIYLPIIFMSIFAYSPLNLFATGDWYSHYLPKVHEAFYVSLLGTLVAGVAALLGARQSTPPPGYRFVYQSIRNFWGTTTGLTLLVSAIVVLGVLTVGTAGVVTMRSSVMEHTEFRPMSHFFSTFAVLGIYVSLIEGYRRRSLPLTCLGVMIVLAMLGFGTRKTTVGTILYYLAVRLINSRTRRVALTVGVTVVTVALMIFTALGVEAARQQKSFLEQFAAAPMHLLFGNNLSELRDFSWMLAAWDHEPLWGSTYACGLTSFLPSFLFPVRTEMGWGTFSTHMTDLDGGGHPGLRPTIFAEAYFNFDLPGVIIFAALLGWVFGRTAAFANRTLQCPDPGERAFRLLCAFLYFEFFLRFNGTANYSLSYVELALLVAGLVGARVVERLNSRSLPQKSSQPPASHLPAVEIVAH